MAIIEFGTDELDVVFETDAAAVVPDVAVDPSPARPAAPPESRTATVDHRVAAWLGQRMSGWWAAGLAVAWIAIFTTGVALEPAPTDPDAAAPAAEAMLALGLVLAWVASAVGFAKRRRFGAAASLFGAVVLVGLTFACVMSGHHTGIGAWWWFELAGSTTLVGISGRALRAA